MKGQPKTEYLKRHKTFLIALFLIVFSVALFAILFRNIKKQDKTQTALFLEEQEQLTDMAAYLAEISEIVDTNREHLTEATLSQIETAQTLSTLSESLTLLDKNLTQIESQIEKQKETQTIRNDKITTAFSSLSESQKEIQQQITSILSGLQEENGNYFITTFEKLESLHEENEHNFNSTTEKLEDMREENERNFNFTTEKLEDMREENERNFNFTTEKLEDMREENERNFNSTTEKLEDMREENERNFNSTTEKLEDMREENKSNFNTAFERLETLQKDFDKIQADTKCYYENLTQLIMLLQEENNMQHNDLMESLLAAKEDISALIENNFANLQLQLDEDVTALMNCLDILHTQIADAELSITNLLTLMEENSTERQGEINAAFASLNAVMEQIRVDYNNAHMQIQQLIQKLQETEDKNHKETLSALTVMESNMTENSLEAFNRITSSLQTMGDSLSSSMDSMQNKFSQNLSNLNTEITGSISQYGNSMTDQINRLNTEITNQYQNLNSSITNQYQNLSATVNNYDNSQQEALNNMLNILNQRLQEVFQYVSNGKKLLASALLTKNVSVREGATFNELYNAILSIPQEIVIGTQEIPGTVTYDYHYHRNASGSMTHSDSQATKGGCYTIPVYHNHTGDSRNGGGCYTVPIMHSHTAACYTITIRERKVTGRWHTGQGTGHGCCDEDHGQNWARFSYEDNVYVNGELVSSVRGEGDLGYCCGLCLDRKASEQASTSTVQDIICGYSDGLNGYGTGCGKNNNTVESYTPGCGLVDGQITGAHIVYDHNAVAMASVAVLSIEEGQAEDSFILEEKMQPEEKSESFTVFENINTASGNHGNPRE